MTVLLQWHFLDFYIHFWTNEIDFVFWTWLKISQWSLEVTKKSDTYWGEYVSYSSHHIPPYMLKQPIMLMLQIILKHGFKSGSNMLQSTITCYTHGLWNETQLNANMTNETHKWRYRTWWTNKCSYQQKQD